MGRFAEFESSLEAILVVVIIFSALTVSFYRGALNCIWHQAAPTGPGMERDMVSVEGGIQVTSMSIVLD
jgi:hypothetical protein